MTNRVLLFALLAAPAAAQFHPRDLVAADPQGGTDGGYWEAVSTFIPPVDNADCTADNEPNWCCTGSGTGICDQAVAAFVTTDCTTRNFDCVGAGDPDACCSGSQTGTCCYEEADSANGGRGNAYCPWGTCVWQWRDQSDWKSGETPEVPSGRPLGQDDLEKAEYVASCTPTGRPCLRGHAPWDEPDYPFGGAGDPTQDATLELEPPGERAWQTSCADGYWVFGAFFKTSATQTDHYWVAAPLKINNDDGRVAYSSASVKLNLTGTGAVSAGAWHWLIMWRDGADDSVYIEINGADVRSGTPTTTDTRAFGQVFCVGKNCTVASDAWVGSNGEEFRGDLAALLFLCRTSVPTSQNRSDLWSYMQATFLNASNLSGVALAGAVLQ